MNTIHFTYVKPTMLPSLGSILHNNSYDLIAKVSDHYTLMNHSEDESFHECVIANILKDDVIKPIKVGRIMLNVPEIYNDLVQAYGIEKVNLIIHEDDNIMRDNIEGVLDFAFDKVYKCDSIQIEFEYDVFYCSTPDIILDTIMSNFNVTSIHNNNNKISATICKKEDK